MGKYDDYENKDIRQLIKSELEKKEMADMQAKKQLAEEEAKKLADQKVIENMLKKAKLKLDILLPSFLEFYTFSCNLNIDGDNSGIVITNIRQKSKSPTSSGHIFRQIVYCNVLPTDKPGQLRAAWQIVDRGDNILLDERQINVTNDLNNFVKGFFHELSKTTPTA